MTEKPFNELVPGDYVADMNDGLGPVRTRFGVVMQVQWRTARTGSPAFNFPNKELHVLGQSQFGSDATGQLVCGYDCDGEFSGIVVISKYVTGPDPRD